LTNFDCRNESSHFRTHFEKAGMITFHHLANACALRNGSRLVAKVAAANETIAEFFEP